VESSNATRAEDRIDGALRFWGSLHIHRYTTLRCHYRKYFEVQDGYGWNMARGVGYDRGRRWYVIFLIFSVLFFYHRYRFDTNIFPAVVIGLCPAFAILIRAGRNPSKKAKYNSGGYIKQDGQSFKLHTIGSSSTRGKNKRIAHGETDLIWTEVNGSQEELAGKPDGISISTTIHQDAESVAGAK
jgi:hypothetical protein